MDEKFENMDTEQAIPEAEQPEEQAPSYVPRPMWQVWLARVCLVVFIAMILLYYINMMRG